MTHTFLLGITPEGKLYRASRDVDYKYLMILNPVDFPAFYDNNGALKEDYCAYERIFKYMDRNLLNGRDLFYIGPTDDDPNDEFLSAGQLKRGEPTMNEKPDCLRFEYEKLFDKDGFCEAFVLHANKNVVEWGELRDSLNILAIYKNHNTCITDLVGFGRFKEEVKKYNLKHCKQPEVDTSVLDGFVEWIIKNKFICSMFGVGQGYPEFKKNIREYKQTLRVDYFVEKK